VREQLNKGIVPPDIDIHALAGLIKVSEIHLSSLIVYVFRGLYFHRGMDVV
jgi:hypothetical protein